MQPTMSQLQGMIQELGIQISAAAERLSNDAMDSSKTLEDINAQQGTLQLLNSRLSAMKAAYAVQYEKDATLLPAANAKEAKDLSAMLKSNEYARAFAHAIRNGLKSSRIRETEECKVLFDAMTIGGGDPTGKDGGFLVPEDINQQIKECAKTLNPLAQYFDQEPVSSDKGWRIKDTAPTLGMESVDEMATLKEGEQPTFSKVPFLLMKYGMFIPMSNELASDEIVNLFGYLARWFAKKGTITENILLLAAINKLTAIDLEAGAELRGIKGVLNKVLDPSISYSAILLTNQSGFDVLDNLVDGTGRPLLDTDPTTGRPVLRTKQPIVMLADSVMPNEEGKAPIFIGDPNQYATLFMRNPLEVASTDVGGLAFRTDSLEIRGIKRMGVSMFDIASMAKCTMTLAA